MKNSAPEIKHFTVIQGGKPEELAQIESKPEWVKEAAKKLLPSMVEIIAYDEFPGTTDPKNPELKQPSHWEQVLGGSGVIVREDGWILTNRHVGFHPGMVYTVRLSADGENAVERPVECFYVDSSRDFAILKIKGSGYIPAEISYEPIEIGERVIAMGSPLLKGTFVSEGVATPPEGGELVDYEEKEPKTRKELKARFDGYISTDADIHPGNSGGALADSKGRVVGINTLGMVDPYGGSIGHAIPINEAKALVKHIESFVLIEMLYNEILAERSIENEVTGKKIMSLEAAVDKFLESVQMIISRYVSAEDRPTATCEILGDRSIRKLFRNLIEPARTKKEAYEKRYAALAGGEPPKAEETKLAA
jgi:S1-C subfamily serine protease